ncbi:MAG: membrane dipeptidase [Anaerolineaceae bacterium]|nr:membrane dipeptidase [Anaerolineaceae bacterium]
MLIWDAHLDLAFNALNANRNLLDPVNKIREKEALKENVVPSGWGQAEGTTAFPEMRKARVAVSFATLLAGVAVEPRPHVDFETVYQAYGIARGHMAYYQALEKSGLVRILTDIESLNSHMTDWERWDSLENADEISSPPLGFIINMEGTDPIMGPEELHEWWALGQRILMPGHFGPGRYTGGTGTTLPLNEMGKALLKEADQLGMILDVNHLSDQAFWQALDCFKGRILASHSNARTLVPGQRQLADDQLKAIIDRQGVIGVCPDVWMLEENWNIGVGTNENVNLNTLVDHIDHICQIAGNSAHVGLGTDLDGGYGYQQCPNDLNTIVDLQKIPALLTARGHSQEDLTNIMYRNYYRLIQDAWK